MQSLSETPSSYKAPRRGDYILPRCGQEAASPTRQLAKRWACSRVPWDVAVASQQKNSISSRRTQCKYAPLSSSAGVLLLVALAALAPLLVEALRSGTHTSGPSQEAHTKAGSGRQHEGRPKSSSSFLADIEDLTDSSVRTRLGTVNIEHLGSAPNDFDQLIERLIPHEWQAPYRTKVSADANNKTSMRFFRNSKTFASIVYTNPLQAGQRQPRQLINCHLVDMEKHSSDVAIYEAKYDIRTIDIEFKEMMQLIEACTNIARLRRRPANGIGQQPAAPGSQYLTSGQQQQSSAQAPSGPLSAPSHGAMRPMVVVGRPAPFVQQQQQQTSASSKNQEVFQQVMSSALQKEFSQLDGRQTRDDSAHLELPQSPLVFTEVHNHHQHGLSISINLGGSHHAGSRTTTPRPHHQHRKRQHLGAQGGKAWTGQRESGKKRARFDPLPTPELYANLSRIARSKFRRQLSAIQRHPLVGALAKVSEQSKRLVLGEVTAPPSLTITGGSNSANGSTALREALEEISSYDTSDLLSIWRGILPGTNWCGMGDRATSYNDLGFESDIDICCRAHDFCPVRLSAFTSGYGLFNWSFYTRSHCWCDQNFLDCLQQAESPLSAVVMKFYFSIMKTTCLNDVETDQQPAAQQQQQQQQHSLAASQVQYQHPAQPPNIPALRQSQWMQTTRQRRPN